MNPAVETKVIDIIKENTGVDFSTPDSNLEKFNELIACNSPDESEEIEIVSGVYANRAMLFALCDPIYFNMEYKAFVAQEEENKKEEEDE